MLSEGFVGSASPPVPGDRPTYGYGSTYRPDGSPVRQGDKITPEAARVLLKRDVANTYEAGVKRCAGDIPMHQYEFDFLVDVAYNMGVRTACASSMVTLFRAGEYAQGCDYILKYDKLLGVHCADPANAGVQGCKGIMARRERQRRMCQGELQ